MALKTSNKKRASNVKCKNVYKFKAVESSYKVEEECKHWARLELHGENKSICYKCGQELQSDDSVQIEHQR